MKFAGEKQKLFFLQLKGRGVSIARMFDVAHKEPVREGAYFATGSNQ